MGIRNIGTLTVVAMFSMACGHAGRSARVDRPAPSAHTTHGAAVDETRLAIGNDEFVPRYANALSMH
jgi:hypothetical protein